ncbi:hypothetical protein Pyn_25353 [Prunus yedoensis var. nudiflora]|uniref:Uncharacterized protein n=1 Tax=Prunus yedoensis var. nudiflora TaxID=2094558 RepID=A0A314UJ35_PRUYE|nr:hypothetical protein Pyn_25353 [Prunus yedoensis var. nudiflora]
MAEGENCLGAGVMGRGLSFQHSPWQISLALFHGEIVPQSAFRKEEGKYKVMPELRTSFLVCHNLHKPKASPLDAIS